MLYIMLTYLMLLYLMLFVCIMLLFSIYFCKCFLFSCFVFVYCHMVCLFHVLTCTMHSAFNLLVFHNSMFTSLLLFFYLWWKDYVLAGEIALRNTHYYYYYYIECLFWLSLFFCVLILTIFLWLQQWLVCRHCLFMFLNKHYSHWCGVCDVVVLECCQFDFL